MLLAQKRIDNLEREVLRVKQHKGALIDTDVWVEGVLQRCRTKELRQHLNTELHKAQQVLVSLVDELESARKRTFELTDIIAKMKRDCDKVSAVSKLFYRAYKKFTSISMQQILQNLDELQKKADALEARKQKDTNVDNMLRSAGEENAIVNKVHI